MPEAHIRWKDEDHETLAPLLEWGRRHGLSIPKTFLLAAKAVSLAQCGDGQLLESLVSLPRSTQLEPQEAPAVRPGTAETASDVSAWIALLGE